MLRLISSILVLGSECSLFEDPPKAHKAGGNPGRDSDAISKRQVATPQCCIVNLLYTRQECNSHVEGVLDIIILIGSWQVNKPVNTTVS